MTEINTNQNPYFNDYDENKKFHQILFNPTKAVQARELSQLQDILQNQIKRTGDFLLANGSKVIGGSTYTDFETFKYIKVNATFDGANIDLTTYPVGSIIVGSTSGAKAEILNTTIATTNDPDTIFVRYLSGDSVTDGVQGISVSASSSDFSGAETVTFTGGGGTGASADLVINGSGTVVGIDVTASGTGYTSIPTIGYTGGTGTSLTATATISTSSSFSADERLSDGTTTIQANVQASSEIPTGNASCFSVDEGIYYIDGFYVKNDAQSILLEKYNNTPTFNVGFDVIQTIIDSSEDSTLLDPSQGSSNFNSPGGDRLKITLTLIKKDLTSQDLDDFIQLVRVNNGKLEQVKSVPLLGELEKTIARRTFDESGSYTVRPFILSVKEHPSDTTKLRIGLEPGKGFVKGFEHETISTTFLDVDKARDSQLVSSGNTIAQYGNYIIVRTEAAGSTFDGMFNINTQETINLYSATAATTQIGTARIRQVEYNNATTLKVYLYDIQLTSDTFTNLESIGLSGTQYADVADSGKVGDTVGGDAILFESDSNSMIFKIPNDVIKSTQDPSLATNYQFRRLISGVSFDASGIASIVLSGTETFPGANTTLNASTEVTNFQIFVTTAGASGFADGDMLTDAQVSSIAINVSGTTATIDTTGTAAFTGDVIATIQTTAEPVKTKTLVTNQKTTINTPNINAQEYDSITKSDIFALKAVYDSTDGNPPRFTIGTITGTFNVDELADQAVSGAVLQIIEAVDSSHIDFIVISGTPDTSGIITGRDSGAVTDAVPLTYTPQTDITTSYILDNGQKDNFYDHGRLQLTGTAPTQTDIVVVYDFFTHSASAGYFSVDSYTGIVDYEDIPEYTSPATGLTVKLSDVFDFRPRRVDGASTITGAEIPIPNTNITADYSFYLARIDKVYLDKDKVFGVKSGNSALVPLTPVDFPDSMTLYVLTLNPYTFDTKDLNTKFIDNKRFTMRDIGSMEQRLSNLEYYTSLSLLEADTKNLLISDGAGNDRFKNGILIDAFKGHSVGDVNDPDYSCSIDFSNTELRSPFNVNQTSLDHDPIDGDDTQNQVTGDVITLPYSEEPFIVQALASKSISVNPFNVTTWRGSLSLVPSSDMWHDKTSLPDITLNLAGEMDAWERLIPESATQTQWNDWETNWAGEQRFVGQQFLGRVPRPGGVRPFGMRQMFDQRLDQSRTGIRTTVVPETITTELGDRVVSQAIIPFIRASTVVISGDGMKPNTRMYPFFDDVDISSFCTPSGGSAGDAIYTDSSGSLSGLSFAIPNDATTKFRTGDRLFRLIDNTTNTITTASTTAEDIYHAAGMLDTVQNTIVSTRVPVVRSETVTEERQITERTTNTIYYDPLAQTFLIDHNIYPDGIFVSRVKLYFAAKPTTTTLPVTVEIRNTQNGFPAQRVVPFSTKTLQPSSVNISADATTSTDFVFDAPVYLQPGEEYALVVLSNSNEYQTYVAEMGEQIIGSDSKVSEQPYAGSLFKSQNASTWTPIQTEDLMFEIHKCLFDITSNGVAIFKNPSVSPDSIADVIHTQAQSVEFSSSNIAWAYKATTNGGSLDSAFINFNVNTNITMPVQKEVNTTVGAFVLRATMNSGSQHISPVIDKERMGLITAENIINTTSTIVNITPITSGTVTTIDYNDNGAGVQDSIGINGGGVWSTDLTRGSVLTVSGSVADDGSYVVESGAGTDTITLKLGEALSGNLGEAPPAASGTFDTEIGPGGNAVSRYITRRVVLQDEFDAKDLKIFLTLNNINGGSVKVYYKVLSSDDPANFDDKDWTLTTQTTASTVVSDTEDDFKEFEFTPTTSPITYTSGAATYNTFKTYAIKLVMQGSTTNPPRIKDLRVIALAT